MPPSASPAVSVCLPCRNAASSLPAALESLLAQTLPDFEIIAVDDGSDDATWEVLCAFAGRDARPQRESRIRPFRLPHQGVALAWNAAVALARAPFIARMDADDLCLPERLALQAALLHAEPDLDLVSGLVRFGGDRETRLGYALHVDWLNSLLTHQDISLGRFVDSPLANPSVMFRREAWERYGPARANTGASGCAPFPEDYEQWLRWLSLGARMGKVQAPVIVWNDPPTRLSRTQDEYGAQAFARIKAGYLWDWLQGRNPQHPRVWAWGAGRESRKRLEPLCALGLVIENYVDIDPRKVGQRVHGVPVLGREAVPPCPSAAAAHTASVHTASDQTTPVHTAPDAAPFILVNVGSRGAREEILQWLAARGYAAGEGCVAMG